MSNGGGAIEDHEGLHGHEGDVGEAEEEVQPCQHGEVEEVGDAELGSAASRSCGPSWK